MRAALYDRPWFLVPEFHTILAERTKDAVEPRADSLSPWAKPASKIDVRPDGIAVISVDGMLMKRPDSFEKWYYGATDIDEITAKLDEAAKQPGVKGAILSIDSPGGAVTGIPELADQVKKFPKPIASFTDNLMASAAYYFGSQADSVYSTPSAQVGSIGVYMAVYDYSQAFKQMGIKVDVIKSGKYKGAGVMGTSLSDEQRQSIQDSVDAMHAQFKAAVKSSRPKVADGDMEGQVYRGEDAASKGLVTGIAANVDEVAKRLLARM